MMDELNQGSNVNQVLNNIKTEFQNPKPNIGRILKTLFDLRAKGKSDQLSDSEFFAIVGATFNLNPDFFLKELYKSFIVKIGKIIGAEKRHEMEKYIIEKYCLAEDEQILYECKGNVDKQFMGSFTAFMLAGMATVSVKSGDVFLTNNRLIAVGLLKARGGGNRKDMKQEIIESSSVFGYEFPFKNLWSLGFLFKKPIVMYVVKIDKILCKISIKPLDKSKQKEDARKIFTLLRRDANDVLEVINEVMEAGLSERKKRIHIWGLLRSLRISEEFTGLSDSEFLNILKETFRLDPEFFMSSIYPKMMSWDDPTFLTVKEQVAELLVKEGANIDEIST